MELQNDTNKEMIKVHDKKISNRFKEGHLLRDGYKPILIIRAIFSRMMIILLPSSIKFLIKKTPRKMTMILIQSQVIIICMWR